MAGNLMNKGKAITSDTASVTDAVRLVLRRIIRLLVGSVSFPALLEIVRKIYVEEAERKLTQDGSRATKSALALMTGLDTRVVTSVLKSDLDSSLQPKNFCAESALLDMWANDPFFQDEATSNPATLPLEGRGRTFQGLVRRSVGRNITVKTVLDRLIQSSNVELQSDATERVKMLSQFYSPLSNDRAEMTDIALYESSRVLSAVIHNMTSPSELRVPQQGRWTYRLSPGRYKEFRLAARELLEKQIAEGEKLLEQFEEKHKEPNQLTVGLGWYQWGGHDTDEESE